MCERGGTRETWSVRYEQLRTDWLRQEIGWGLSLFVRQGMAAWMKAWPAEASPTGTAETVASASDRSPPVVMTGGFQSQLTRELANLILHRQQEVVA